MIRRLFKPTAAEPPLTPPAIPAGRRVYAIGDVHGRLDLLDRLLTEIDADDQARGPATTTIVFLGDLIDRGPHSCGVIDRVIALQHTRDVRIIMGNHEETFLAALDDRDGAMRFFTRIGGQETILSYPIDEAEYSAADYIGLVALCRERIPAEHRAFIAGFKKWVAIGDYLFVHAGIRPGVPLDEQRASDLRWIRETFLDHPGHHGHMIVHGHTIRDRVEARPNRVGIDTGAYQTSRLTALGLQDTSRWLLDTIEEGVTIIACSR